MEPEAVEAAQSQPGSIEIGEAAAFLCRERARYKVLYGGRGGLKSWSAARTLLLAGVDRTLRILCAREFQNSIADSVHRLLADQIALMGLGNFYQVQNTTILGANGTELIFVGLRYNVESIKSLEGVDICWVEEAERVSERSWEILVPTIRKAGSEIWVTFNPAQESDPTYQRFVVNPPPGAIVRRVSWKDNPWLPDELRQEAELLRRTDPEAYMHVWEGETVGRSDAQVLAGKWRIDAFTPQKGWHGPYFGADWGFANDPTALVRLWIEQRLPSRDEVIAATQERKSPPSHRVLYVEHEAVKVGCDLVDTPALFDSVPDVRRYMIRADCARPETISHMARAGFRIEGCPKWRGSVEDGVAHLRSYDAIVVHPRCRNFAQECRLYSYKVDRLTGDVMPDIVDKHNHGIDAARYALNPLIQQRPTVWRGAVYAPYHWG